MSKIKGVLLGMIGAGIALLYVICALCMLLVGLVGFTVPLVRDVEKSVPDHDQAIL
ncbi:hypothetical protein [Nodularia sp. UHCC 0506]|uniref:hypothetical protein n=1 Tax=Nodularia sp. UHCC 0506 TaxID=3110243 RepID=UPI002B208CAD|nr:hypothetical protein [Nodularia sp. UHCC 0506]MEA5513481.1 hypothetical protein [Nodularia sp. UHCC 0506]